MCCFDAATTSKMSLLLNDCNMPHSATFQPSLCFPESDSYLQAELPQNILRVDGRTSRMKRNQEQYSAIESKQGMIPWNGQQDNLIDRFDGRALLDFYKEPDAQSNRQRKTEDEVELEEVTALPPLLHWVVSNIVCFSFRMLRMQ